MKIIFLFGFEGTTFENLLETAENTEYSHGGLQSKTFSSIAQWQSTRLLTELLQVRALLGEFFYQIHQIRQAAITRGSMVKRLRHRPFTAVTRVRFPLESFNYIWRSSQVVRQWSATPVSTGSNPVCASPEGPRKLIVSGVFSCPENLCVTNLYIAETRIKSRVTGIFLCFKIAILIPLYQ